MRSLYDFIIKPLGERYDNEKKVGDKTLVLNTKIESFKSVNNLATVIATPTAFNTGISPGDIVVVHHNVFRRFYDMKGREKNSRSYFKEDMYFCSSDQIYLYKKDVEWLSHMDRCFVKPIEETSMFSTDKEKPLIGIVKYDNPYLNKLGVEIGMLVTFTPNSEFEFIINDERLYCMKSNNIAIKHEYQGNETEYNPSWAHSG
jgi:hypothetical protein